MRKTGRTRTARALESETARPAEGAVEALEPDPLWPIAMLRIAMELKRPEAPGLDEIINGVVKKMGISKARFERYVSEHLGTLQEAAKRNGYAR